ncbi:hypothetical protein ABH991_007653 [Bradyrhizobium ottawaense]|uniref:ATP-binding protein n=1 Tax=Bradyrhizobium ottawaense TaxID=931866 RepID=UPI003515238E
MMELRHLTMVNWHLFDVADIDVRGHVGVLGENRSGKSTILDMAQVVLTGGSRRFLRLNAVAGDSGKSRSGSKRSVVDYCLGTLGEDQRRRDEARTYIALGFEDTEGARSPVTIGMALEARKSDSRETVLALFVAVGTVLSSKDFIEQRGKSQFPAQWEDVRARSSQRSAKATSSIIATGRATMSASTCAIFCRIRPLANRTPAPCRNQSSTR